jgi:prepilin-type N-terminal cleavage/methylation domain-containing protein
VTRPRCPDDSEQGFTLVEILVASTVAAIMLIGLLRGFSSGAESAASSAAYEEAVAIAESTLELLGTETPLVDGRGFERRQGRFTVIAAIRRYPLAESSTYVVPYDLSVTVGWGDGAHRRSIALRTLRLGPQQS